MGCREKLPVREQSRCAALPREADRRILPCRWHHHIRLHAWASRATSQAHRGRSEEHTSELQSLMRISYAVFCLKKKTNQTQQTVTIKKTIRTTQNKQTRESTR